MKNILLIGGSTGIGYELSQKLKEDNNLFIATRDKEKFNDTNIKTKDLNLNHEFETDWLPDHIDGFVYLPGTINLRPFKGLKPSVFLEDFKINVMGCVEILQKVLPKIQAAKNPSIVMFSTVAVKLGMPFHASVAASKSAVEGLTKSLGAELAPTIRVNAIAPTVTDTDLASKLLRNERMIENMNERHPLKKYLQPQEVADMAAFLLSDKAASLSGQIFEMDCGIVSFKI